MKTLKLYGPLLALAVTSVSLVGCGSQSQSSAAQRPPINISWTSTFTAGSQSGPINFIAVGQTATVLVTESCPTAGGPQCNVISAGPFNRTLSPASCSSVVSVTQAFPSASLVVTATGAGSCTITFRDPNNSASGNIKVSVP